MKRLSNEGRTKAALLLVGAGELETALRERAAEGDRQDDIFCRIPESNPYADRVCTG